MWRSRFIQQISIKNCIIRRRALVQIQENALSAFLAQWLERCKKESSKCTFSSVG